MIKLNIKPIKKRKQAKGLSHIYSFSDVGPKDSWWEMPGEHTERFHINTETDTEKYIKLDMFWLSVHYPKLLFV